MAELKDTPLGAIAHEFATHLVRGRYDKARAMMSTALQAVVSNDRLDLDFNGLIAYGEGLPDHVEVTSILDDWYGMQPEDIGWAYVAIGGEIYYEGVSVVVTKENGRKVIREFELGRL